MSFSLTFILELGNKLVQCNTMTGQEVQEAFLAAPPLVAQQILDLSIKHPNWLRDVYETEEWPRGNGTIMEQLVFRGALPQIERGFEAWKKLNNNTGCDVSCSPDCGYNWTQLGGNGFERKVTELMRREFRSPSYCISEIQTTAHFKEVFAKIVENLYAQVDFFKEINIGQNFLTGLSKKYVVDSGGAKPNTQNPYVYRPIGAARLSALNITLLEFFYEWMRRLPDCIPYDVVNGSPVFSLICSHQLLSRLYRDDPNLRQDVRFSSMATDMLMKYNFMSTIRGMFIAAPILYPRRFNNVNGVWMEVLPFVNGVPAEVGSYTGMNPAYESATHEEVILHGKYPFKVFYFPTEETLGANTSFGPEYSWFNAWKWINPETIQDPFRRVGFFATSASIGLSQQFSDGLFGVLVERPSVRSMAVFLPEPECPPDPVTCDNEVPAVTCPCPLIMSVTPDPFHESWYTFVFSTPMSVAPNDPIEIALDTGGYLTGIVEAVSTDGLTVSVYFAAGACPSCTHFTGVYCDDTLGCSSEVLSACACETSTGTNGSSRDYAVISVLLKNPIKATAGEVVTVYTCLGTSGAATIVSVSDCTNTYVLRLDESDFVCLDNNNIVTVCVPPSTDPTCPACGGAPTITYCS